MINGRGVDRMHKRKGDGWDCLNEKHKLKMLGQFFFFFFGTRVKAKAAGRIESNNEAGRLAAKLELHCDTHIKSTRHRAKKKAMHNRKMHNQSKI